MGNFDNVKLEKGLYALGGFNSALEALDPDENYRGSSLEGLDAYQRQLKRFGIRVGGADSDTVEKFFSTADSAVLFPEFVSRAVRRGMLSADILPEITAAVTNINSADYRSLTCVGSENDTELKTVGEGAFIPETSIHTKDNLVSLMKRGRSLVASYEAIKYQRLDLFAVTLRQIGAYISRTLLKDAVNVLINGDGNNNPAEVIRCETPGTLTYSDLVNFWNSFEPFSLNTLIASPDMMAAILNMSEFRDAPAGLNFHGTGEVITPFGAKLLRSSAVPQGNIIGLDKNAALEMVKAGGVLTEYDKLIDRQLERAVISCTAGFAKINDGAAKILSL
ncbi:MAG: phage major capsid protein [Clostridia bacterium]|nr:phage major capsid protein [Clostridia bacterium]